jgi:hypothetical protein
MSEELLPGENPIDLNQIKSMINSMSNLPISAHSAEFEKIHQQLQQALTNLDGV